MKTVCFSILITLLLLTTMVDGQQYIGKVVLQNTSSELYKKIEWDIDATVAFKNPYDVDEVSFDMLLTAPSGRKIILPCYYDHGASGEISKWKARFAPQEIGKYIYSLKLINNKIVQTTKESSFIVRPSNAEGFLHINNMWTLKFDSGKPFRGFGENIGWEGRLQEDPKNTFDYFLPKLKQNCGNFFRTFINHWNLPIEWNIVEVPKRTNKLYKNSITIYHPAGIKRLDELVALSDSLNLHMMLMIEWQNNLRPDQNWPINPYNKANGGPAKTPAEFFTNSDAKHMFKNRLRYMVARWGYSPAIGAWELMNEVDNAVYDKIKDVGGSNKDSIVIPHQAITQWHKEMATYLKDIDPYKHIVTTSISHRQIKGLFEVPEMDINQQHIYRRTDSIPSTIEKKQMEYHHPFVIGEFGFRWENGDPKYWDDYFFHFKKGLWYGLFNPTPILPLTWWWELFDAKNGLLPLKSIKEINAEMLDAGHGAFNKIDIDAKPFTAYAVSCGESYFIYLVNNDSSAITSPVSIKVNNQKSYLLKKINPDDSQFAAAVKVQKNIEGVTVCPIDLKPRQELIMIISPEKRINL